jgi:hypothetical protein
MSPPAADGGGVLEASVMANGSGVTEPLDDAHVTASSSRFATVLRCGGGRTQQFADCAIGQAGRGAQLLHVMFDLFGVWWPPGVCEMVWEADGVCQLSRSDAKSGGVGVQPGG